MKKIYSFDLFDTLVTRKVNHPKDVFTLVEATGIVEFRFFLNVFFSFKGLRVFSEKLSRFLYKSKKEDINIFDIYRILGLFIKNAKVVLRKEIEVELQVIYPLDENIKILNEILMVSKKLCITSDMYLPKNILKKILKINNIDVDLIYVSSEIGLTKHSGNMFKYIAKKNDLELSKIYHYGDNIHSDYNVPRKMGIKAYHMGIPQHRQSNGFLDCFRSPIQDDLYYKLGYEFCGKLAYLFANDIYNNADLNRNLVFGARDSHLFKYAFDLFFNQDHQYKDFYTRISRKLVYLPEIYFSKKYDRLFFETMLCDEFFSRIGLICPYELIGKSVWLNKKKIEDILKKNKSFNEELQKDSIQVKDYLKTNGFNSDVCFVDLGWKGSIQDSLEIIFKDEINIKGHYVGVVNKNKMKKGFLFENKKSYQLYFYVMQCISLFEFLFTEPELSLQKIEKNHGQYKFLFANDESQEQVNARVRIKEGAQQFLKDYFELNQKLNFEVEYAKKSVKPLLYENLMRVKEDFITAFSDLSHSAGFNASLQSKLIEFSGFSIVGYLKAPWKSYFMFELRKKSKFKFMIFIILFHNVFFFVFYENLKNLYRKIRGMIYG